MFGIKPSAVELQDINVVGAEALEAPFHIGGDACRLERFCLSSDNACLAPFCNRLADDDFAVTAAVGRRGVEIVDAAVKGVVEHLDELPLIVLGADSAAAVSNF